MLFAGGNEVIKLQKLELGSLWLWSLCFLYHPIHIPERSITRHSCAVPRLLINYLPGQIPLKMPLNSGFPYSLGLLLLLGTVPLSRFQQQVLDSHSFSLGTWQIGILLLAPRLALGYLVHHYPFLHFWLMVSGVSVLGSLVPITQDLWQLSPLLWETWGRLFINCS